MYRKMASGKITRSKKSSQEDEGKSETYHSMLEKFKALVLIDLIYIIKPYKKDWVRMNCSPIFLTFWLLYNEQTQWTIFLLL